MSECLNASGSSQPLKEQDVTDEEAMFLEDFKEEEGSKISIWFVIALAVLGATLIWIILGVWRYLQVLGNGAF
jgi:hypothetical protein